MSHTNTGQVVLGAIAALLAALAATGYVERGVLDAEQNAAGQAQDTAAEQLRGASDARAESPVPAAPSYAAPQTSASARTDGHYALRPTGSAVAAPSTWPQALAACMNGGSVVYEDPLTGNSIGIFCDRQVVSAAVANHNRGMP